MVDSYAGGDASAGLVGAGRKGLGFKDCGTESRADCPLTFVLDALRGLRVASSDCRSPEACIAYGGRQC